VTGFEVYKTYLAIKLHFTKDDYNYFTFNGKSRASESSFEKRKDRYFFKKLGTKFDKETILQFFVSHFVENSNTWIGDLSVYNSSTFNAWKKKIQSMTFMFENDIDYLIDVCNFESIFDCKTGNHPVLLQAYLGERITLETMVILDGIFDYSSKWDKKMSDDIMWPDVKKLIENYKKFLTYPHDSCKMVVINLTTME